MAPFLRDDGPPVSKETIQRARESLPLEYGTLTVNETGREVLLVRVPKAKPDYLHDLADVAFYVSLEQIRNTKDVLLVGHEKTARLEPQLLRDNIRAQDREDQDLVADLRRRLGRDFAHVILQSPSNHQHQAIAVRIPKRSVADFTPDDVRTIRDVVAAQGGRSAACQYAYIVADKDHERLGRRVLNELLGEASAAPAQSAPAPLAVEPAAAPSAPTLAQRLGALPPTPGSAPAANAATAATFAPPAFAPDASAPAPAAPAQEAPVVTSSGTLPAFLARAASATASPTPQPAATAPAERAPPAPTLAPTPVADTPEAAPATAAAADIAPPPPTEAPSAPIVEDREEYAIISKPKPAAPTPPAHPARAAHAPRGLSLAAAPDAEVQDHDEYAIVSKPKAPPTAPPATRGPPAALPATRAPPAAADPHAGKLAVEAGAEHHVEKEYEIVAKPKAPAPAAAATAAPHEPEPERQVAKATSEYEVFTSKPKPREGPTITPPGQGGFQAALNHAASAIAAPKKTREYEIMGARPPPTAESPAVAKLLAHGHGAPASTTLDAAPGASAPSGRDPRATTTAPPAPPGAPAPQAPPHPAAFAASAATGAFAPAALPHSTHSPQAPAVAAPTSAAPAFSPTVAPAAFVPTSAPPIAAAPAAAPPAAPIARPADDPRVQAALSARAPVAPPASADNGATLLATVAPAQPELVLMQRFRDAGYDIVEGLRAQGTQFAFAAHRPNGRRVLTKRAAEFGPDDAATLAKLVTALGADIGLVVADRVAPGTRLATWGTRIEVYTPTEAMQLGF